MGHKNMHGDISNQFIHFREMHDALIYTIAGAELRVADGVAPNKSRDTPRVEHTPSKVRARVPIKNESFISPVQVSGKVTLPGG